MPSSLDFSLSLATLFTSLLSGVFGMAGGMVLMGILSTQLLIPQVMVFHGIAQSVSNGSRSFFLHKHILFTIILPYLLGSLFIFTLFYLLTVSLPLPYILIAIGFFPFLARTLPKKFSLNIAKKTHSLLCGVLITMIQLLAGASGPILDIFYLQSTLSKEEIIANKSFTQTVGHCTKVIYYILLAAKTTEGIWIPSLYSVFAIIAFSLMGTYLGVSLLKKISSAFFFRWSNWIVLLLGSIFITRGLILIFNH